MDPNEFIKALMQFNPVTILPSLVQQGGDYASQYYQKLMQMMQGMGGGPSVAANPFQSIPMLGTMPAIGTMLPTTNSGYHRALAEMSNMPLSPSDIQPAMPIPNARMGSDTYTNMPAKAPAGLYEFLMGGGNK